MNFGPQNLKSTKINRAVTLGMWIERQRDSLFEKYVVLLLEKDRSSLYSILNVEWDQ